MKYSIRTKIIALIIFSLILPAIILGGTSIFFTQKMTDNYVRENINLICEKKTAEINCIFTPLEQSVDYMSINALEEVTNLYNLTDQIYYDNYMDKMRSIMWNTSNNTEGAVAVYLRIDPVKFGGLAGLFMTRESINSEMRVTTPTDLFAYPEDDVEHVGWYYAPIKAGQPIWMLPYYNKNIDIYMISYIVPLFKGNETLGVLGMDINFNYITDQVKNIEIYDSGYAYITDSEGNIIYHPNIEYGEPFTLLEGWTNSSCKLQNGMVLNITVPIAEVNAERNKLVMAIIISTFILIIIFVITTIHITNRMIAPLQNLNKIANEISGGNYDVNFNFTRPKDEIGQLTNSFENTVNTLKEYNAYINGLAYRDSLTGVRNRTAYEHQISLLEDAINNGEDITFSIAVFDVNNLKYINDNFGHEKGDILINGASKMICRIFSHCAVFRIGGDEFTAIIREEDDTKIVQLFKSFEEEMEKTWADEAIEQRISVAYGYSKYDPNMDDGKADFAFKRADSLMYEKKKSLKERFNVAQKEGLI